MAAGECIVLAIMSPPVKMIDADRLECFGSEFSKFEILQNEGIVETGEASLQKWFDECERLIMPGRKYRFVFQVLE